MVSEPHSVDLRVDGASTVLCSFSEVATCLLQSKQQYANYLCIPLCRHFAASGCSPDTTLCSTPLSIKQKKQTQKYTKRSTAPHISASAVGHRASFDRFYRIQYRKTPPRSLSTTHRPSRCLTVIFSFTVYFFPSFTTSSPRCSPFWRQTTSTNNFAFFT